MKKKTKQNKSKAKTGSGRRPDKFGLMRGE